MSRKKQKIKIVYEEDTDMPIEERIERVNRAYAVVFNAMRRDGVMWHQQKENHDKGKPTETDF